MSVSKVGIELLGQLKICNNKLFMWNMAFSLYIGMFSKKVKPLQEDQLLKC